jgi:hypothetical protein
VATAEVLTCSGSTAAHAPTAPRTAAGWGRVVVTSNIDAVDLEGQQLGAKAASLAAIEHPVEIDQERANISE